MPVLTLTIHGPPIGKGRPRFSRASGRAYTPTTTAEWQGRARAQIATQLPADWMMIEDLCSVHIEAVFDRAKRMLCTHSSGRCQCESRHPAGKRLPHTAKPDGDNVTKITWDAMVEAGVLRDDCLICDSSISKRYATATEPSRVEVRVRWGDDFDAIPWSPLPQGEW